MRDLKSAPDLRADAERERLSIETIQLDVTDETSVNKAVSQVLNAERRIDVVVNNAGFGAGGPVEDYTDDEIKHVFETNFFGTIRVTRAALSAMRHQRSGTVIMISSVSGLRTFPFSPVYSASKFALEAISNGLRYELRPFGIRVVLIEPGNFLTRNNAFYPKRLMPGSSDGSSDPLYVRLMENRAKAPRNFVVGDPQDVAREVVDAAEAEAPMRRYLVGDADAHRVVSLSPDDFEQMIEASMNLVI